MLVFFAYVQVGIVAKRGVRAFSGDITFISYDQCMINTSIDGAVHNVAYMLLDMRSVHSVIMI
jgi:hypothetical protein